MAKFFQKLSNALLLGVGLLLGLLLVLDFPQFDQAGWAFLFRWLHVLSGIMWIGLLWYFNFVQIPSMPSISDAQKPAITQVIAPRALFWFRWAAVATLVTGLILAMLSGYLVDALTLGLMDPYASERSVAIGIGMWLGIIMLLNVWAVIWPHQKRALGIVKASDAQKKASATTAMMFSRINTALSIPMLYSMVSAQNLY
ncbi:MAG: urate hydroxylase PuuD [Alphaproteobacteria bacterium GM7ARS4]|nr:urate hydroxylase PuuD [Alphaproteobacteria bacterium GM7ARS4]